MPSIENSLSKAFSILGKRLVIIVSFFGVIVSLFDLISVSVLYPYIEFLTDPSCEMPKMLDFLFKKIFQLHTIDVVDYSIIILFVVVLASLVKAGFTYFQVYELRRIRVEVSDRCFQKLKSLGYSSTRNIEAGRIESMFVTEIDLVVQHVLSPILSIANYLTVSLLLFVYLLFVSPALLALSVIVFGVYYSVVGLIIRKRLVTIKHQRTKSNLGRIEKTKDLINSLDVIDQYNAWSFFDRSLHNDVLQFSESSEKNQFLLKLPQIILEGLLYSMVVLVVLYFSSRGSLLNFLPEITVFAFSALKLKPSLNSLYGLFVSINFGMGGLDNISDFLRHSKVENSNDCLERRYVKGDGVSILIKDLDYSYSGSSLEVFDKLNLQFNVSSITCITGTSGRGKSTLLYLLCGLLKVSAGHIRVDSSHPTETDLFKIVPQNNRLITGDVYQNVALKKSISMDDKKRIQGILNRLGLNLFIRKGVVQGMSGGQKQRLGIARALFTDSKCLLFDEPTSGLDLKTKKSFIELAKTISEDRLLIIVTHDQDVMEIADNVVTI